jgi:glycosyltransferase involved in cell wall biosynthesis
MRICQVMLAKGFGGAERYFVDLCRELAQRGHEVLAVCHPSGMALERLHGAAVSIATVHSLGPWDPFAVRRLRTCIDGFRPAVIQAHLSRAAHLAGKALRNSQARLIAKTHNYVNLKYYHNVGMFLPTTRDQAKYLQQQGIAPERMQVIPNFSTLAPVMPPADRPPTLVAMGRFVHKKGFRVLLIALREMRRRNVPLPPVLLAGDGPLRAELEREVRHIGLGDVVQFVGWQLDPAAFLDRGTLFVLPSLDEPFGIAVLEAMARGLPIVATATQGPREILDGEIAALVPPGDSEALAAALIQSLTHPAESRARAMRALQRFQSSYTADVVVPQLLAVYDAVRESSANQAGGT